jgi:hypothetical protein
MLLGSPTCWAGMPSWPRASGYPWGAEEVRNGFREPPAWSEYAPTFVERYLAARTDCVRRLDPPGVDRVMSVVVPCKEERLS